MSEALKITLTALAGVTVFVLGQIFVKWFIEPIQEQRRLRGKIIYGISYYSNTSFEDSGPEKAEQAKYWLRDLAAELQGNMSVIPWYRLLAFFRIVEKEDVVFTVSAYLLRLADHLTEPTSVPQNIIYRDAIMKRLKRKHVINSSDYKRKTDTDTLPPLLSSLPEGKSIK